MPNVPPANIVAMFDTALMYGSYESIRLRTKVSNSQCRVRSHRLSTATTRCSTPFAAWAGWGMMDRGRGGRPHMYRQPPHAQLPEIRDLLAEYGMEVCHVIPRTVPLPVAPSVDE